MASRTWLAVLLSLFVWFAYLKWFAPPPPQLPTKTAQEASSKPAPSVTNSGNITLENNTGAVPNNILKNVDVFTLIPQQSQDFEKTREKAKFVFSKWGGRISQVELFDYRQTIEKDSAFVSPIQPDRNDFTLATVFSGDLLKEYSFGEYAVSESGNSVTFVRQGLARVTKRFEFQDSSDYAVNATLKVEVPKNVVGIGGADLGYLYVPGGAKGVTFDLNKPLESWEFVVSQDDELERNNLTDISEEEKEVLTGRTKWIAFGNRYFSSVVINESKLNPDVVLLARESFKGGYMRFPLRLKPGESELEFQFTYYVGPKKAEELDKFPGLSQLVDFGFFSFFSYPLLTLLNFFYAFVKNYGIAIILLTIVVRVLMYPLSAKGFQSMKRMQKLQPQIKALKEKYGDDRERFNREQMALMKSHKVNPLGGCVPLLVQIPVFFALYTLLANSMELFHAPFFWWIQDLSAHDPFYVFPVLMGITMFLQQKLTPAVGMDPMQQKIMMFGMPAILTFVMLNLPSGITLYFFVSNLLGIAQQYAMTKDPKDAAAPAKKTPKKVKT